MKLEIEQLAELAKQAKIKLNASESAYFYKEINNTLQLFKNLKKWDIENYDTNDEY